MALPSEFLLQQRHSGRAEIFANGGTNSRRQSEGIEKYPGDGSEKVQKTGLWREY